MGTAEKPGMATTLNKLKPGDVKTLGPGRHSDGGGLYLEKDNKGRLSWVFMFKRNGKRREMGLGSADPNAGLGLAAARRARDEARKVVEAGGDPIEARKAPIAEAPSIPTFGEVADAYVSDLSPQWRNEKHRAQWAMTLKEHGAPLRALPVDQVDTTAVLGVLKPIWGKTPETASRLRGRIERVLDAAKAQGHRSGENPARWRGHLDHLLPKRQKLTRGHHAAIDYTELPAFMAMLRGRSATAARALEFTILTAARSGEVLGAKWPEMDLDAGLWTVPAERMKAGREHRVALSEPAVRLLRRLHETWSCEYVFANQRGKGALSGMSMTMVLRRMKRDDITAHGMRSAFRDWAAETTPHPSEVVEMALAHTIANKVEAAYRRGDLFEKRRALMRDWAAYCGTVAT